MEIRDFRPLRKNTLLGFFTLALDSGLVIRDCTLHESHGKRWFGFPGRPMLDKGGELMRKDGKVQYAQMIEVPDRIRQEKLQAIVVDLSRDVA